MKTCRLERTATEALRDPEAQGTVGIRPADSAQHGSQGHNPRHGFQLPHGARQRKLRQGIFTLLLTQTSAQTRAPGGSRYRFERPDSLAQPLKGGKRRLLQLFSATEWAGRLLSCLRV